MRGTSAPSRGLPHGGTAALGRATRARGRFPEGVGDMRGTRLAWLVAAIVVITGCASGESDPAASPAPTSTLTAAERAEAALVPAEETEPVAPGTVSDATSPYTAEGDQISAPWGQFMTCSTVGKADEGPPSVVEPRAAAAAWTFGKAGAAQVDQYAIVYADEAAAAEAVTRARTQAQSCDEAFAANPEFRGEPPTTTIGGVPDTVDGFRVTAVYRPSDDEVSTVMRSGDTVHYMRFREMSAVESAPGESEKNPDTALDPAWTDALIDQAAANLVG